MPLKYLHSMHSSEQVFCILCLTHRMFILYHRTLCSCVGATGGYHSHPSTRLYCAQQAELPCARVTYMSTSFTSCNYNNNVMILVLNSVLLHCAMIILLYNKLRNCTRIVRFRRKLLGAIKTVAGETVCGEMD